MGCVHEGGRRSFLAGTAASLAVPAAARAAFLPDRATVTVGLPPGYMGAIVDYAQARGTFRDAGLDVQSSILGSGAVVAAAVTGGAVDFGAVNVGSLASARLRGIPLRIVAPAAYVPLGPDGDVVLVRRDSTLRQGPDFDGKTVAIVALRTVQHAAFLAWLAKRGGDPAGVKMIEIPLPEMAGALEARRVDAAITNEPFTTKALATNRSLGTVYDAMPRPFLVFAMCATEPWLDANPVTATRFAAAIRRAAAWANGHESACRALLATAMKLTPQVANAMLMPTPGTSLDPSTIRPVIDVMVRYGFLAKAIDPEELLWHPKT